MLDPLGAISKIRQIRESENNDVLEAAPLSISQRDNHVRGIRENYFYNPGLGEVPQIDVPLDLPDLPGNILLFILLFHLIINFLTQIFIFYLSVSFVLILNKYRVKINYRGKFDKKCLFILDILKF